MSHGDFGSKEYQKGLRLDGRSQGRQLFSGKGAGAGHHRILRQRQDHPSAVPELSGNARRGRNPCGRPTAQRRPLDRRAGTAEPSSLRSGVPEFQPVPSVYRAGKYHSGSQAAQKERSCRHPGNGAEASRPGGAAAKTGRLSLPAVRRTAAAGGHRPGAGAESSGAVL